MIEYITLGLVVLALMTLASRMDLRHIMRTIRERDLDLRTEVETSLSQQNSLLEMLAQTIEMVLVVNPAPKGSNDWPAVFDKTGHQLGDTFQYNLNLKEAMATSQMLSDSQIPHRFVATKRYLAKGEETLWRIHVPESSMDDAARVLGSRNEAATAAAARVVQGELISQGRYVERGEPVDTIWQSPRIVNNDNVRPIDEGLMKEMYDEGDKA